MLGIIAQILSQGLSQGLSQVLSQVRLIQVKPQMDRPSSLAIHPSPVDEVGESAKFC